MTRFKGSLALMAAGILLTPAAAQAQAQSNGSSGAGQFQAGYGAARYTTAQPQSGSTRDANGNRLVVNGIIQSGASAYSSSSAGAASSVSGVGSGGSGGVAGASAIGNSLNVVVQGDHNTVIVNSRQTNTGDITAGTALNGTLDLDD